MEITFTTLTKLAGSTDLEELEDVIAAALYAAGWRGQLESSTTWNCTDFDPAQGEIYEWLVDTLDALRGKCDMIFAALQDGKLNVDDTEEVLPYTAWKAKRGTE